MKYIMVLVGTPRGVFQIKHIVRSNSNISQLKFIVYKPLPCNFVVHNIVFVVPTIVFFVTNDSVIFLRWG